MSFVVNSSSSLNVNSNAGTGYIWPMAMEGSLLVVGDANYSASTNYGRALIYTRSSDNDWSLERTIYHPSGSTNIGFGVEVGVSNGTIAIGAPFDKQIISNGGAIFIYTDHGATFQTCLRPADTKQNDYCGFRGRFRIVGSQILASAPGHAKTTLGDGCLFYWTGTSASWTEGAEVASPNPAIGGNMGYYLDFDGTHALVHRSSNTGQTDMYVFGWNGTTWANMQTITPETSRTIAGLAINGSIAAAFVLTGSYNKLHIFESGAIAGWTDIGTAYTQSYGASTVVWPQRVTVNEDGNVIYGDGNAGTAGVLRIYNKHTNNTWNLAQAITSSTGVGAGAGATTVTTGSGAALYIGSGDWNSAAGDDIVIYYCSDLLPPELSLISCSLPTIGPDFTLNHYKCLRNQFTNPAQTTNPENVPFSKAHQGTNIRIQKTGYKGDLD